MAKIVAEISGNHGGSLLRAIDMIWRAADCGCDYAKFQFYRPEDMPDRHEGDNDEMYRKLMVPDQWLPDLFIESREACIGLFASVFSVRAVETLLTFDVPYIKIASPESTRLPYKTYQEIAEAVPPDVGLIVSTNIEDMPVMRGLGGHLMYCPSDHPPTITQADLDYFDEPSMFMGFSDHTSGIRTPVAFMNAGAKMIEKHFKINDDCIDKDFSAVPKTMELLCKLAHNR